MARTGQLVGALVLLGTAAPAALGFGAKPLSGQTGVVIGYAADTHTATVALQSGEVVAIRDRNAIWRPGTKVRMDGLPSGAANGIKWTTGAGGIKWTVPPGIKWGVKVNQDGSLATRMRAIGRTSSARVKAVVVADIGRRALGLAAPGTTFVVVTPKPPSRAVKGAKASHALRRTPVGTRVSLVVGIGPRGVLRAKTLKEIGRATLGDYVPLSGTVTAVDAGRRTVTLTSQSGAFRMRFVLHVADSANLASFVLGHRLSLSAALDAGGTFLSVGTAAATTEQTIAPSLADPPAQPSAPPAQPAGETPPPAAPPAAPPAPPTQSPDPSPQPAATIDGLITLWTSAGQGGAIQRGLYMSERYRLLRIRDEIAKDDDDAREDLDRFIADVARGTPKKIDRGTSAAVIFYALAVRVTL